MPIRILYVITELDLGGAEKALYELVRRLDPERYAPAVVSLAGGGPQSGGIVAGWLAAQGIAVHSLGLSAPNRSRQGPGAGLVNGLRAVRRLRRLVARLRPDILHTMLIHANVVGRLAAVHSLPRARPRRPRGTGCWQPVVGQDTGCRQPVPHATHPSGGRRPVVISGIRVAERRCRWHLLADYLTHRLADCEVCVSEGVRWFMRRQARIPPGKLRVIPNGVDLEAIGAVRPAGLSGLGCRADRATLGFVGRLDRQKGLPFLLHALARLRRAPPWQALLVGEGPEREALGALVRDLRLGERVRLLGWRPDALAIVAACDVVVMPSLWEGMPNAVMEAMALGRCVIATAVEGSRELIESGRSGLLVPPGSVRALADAITVALTNPDRRAVLGRAARRRIVERFPIERTVAQYDALYSELLAGRRRE